MNKKQFIFPGRSRRRFRWTGNTIGACLLLELYNRWAQACPPRPDNRKVYRIIKRSIERSWTIALASSRR